MLKMRKLDAILAALIGFFNGIFFFFILRERGGEIEFLKNFRPYSWILIIIFPPLGALGLYIASIIGKKILILFQAAKFFLVGTLNTFIDIGVVEFLILITKIEVGGPVTFFKAISFLTATTNSYFWNKYWTFGKREKIKPEEFLKFLIITTIGLLINVSIFHFIFTILGPKFGIKIGTWRIISVILAAFFAFMWNFLGSKFIVFKK